jgi:hypothetical protein
MITKKSWEEFQKTGLLWLINSILHLFGWAIVFEVYNNDPDNILNVYPARVKFRGFREESNDRGYKKITKYLKENIDDLISECEE